VNHFQGKVFESCEIGRGRYGVERGSKSTTGVPRS